MKKKWKITLAVALLLAVAGGVYGGIKYQQRGIVTVQTGRVFRQDLVSVVTASGEIKPRNYINIGANVQGRITDLTVIEGDRVQKNQVLARLESIQAQADVAAMRAAVSSAEAESAATEAGVRAASENVETARATVDRAKAELDRARTDFNRTEQLYNAKLIAKQEYDQRKSMVAAQEAAVREVEARVEQLGAQKQQTAAQLSAQQRRITQTQANLRRAADFLDKFNAYAPIDGVITNLPVRVGEVVVPGIQNSPASTIMTIADMSIITAEVKVDETDIVNVKLGQTADITIDAMPNRTFKGRVIEIGNTAILRSTGVAASQSAISSQEAKDFKVVIAMDSPPEDIRPGLSCTAKVTTASRPKVLTIPIQALTVRQQGDLEARTDAKGSQPLDPVKERERKKELQGVFVVAGEKAQFRKVETGITGVAEIEVLNGVQDGEEILTGSYKAIRTLKNGAKIKVDNKAPSETKS